MELEKYNIVSFCRTKFEICFCLKDVTQQSLCDLGAVDLVEKCARFHIHCTARLCELDMQDFDQKINDENLTKCMQTLKHMYYDLSVKQIFCPNEAEFRAYDILLHLNVGDTLRLVFIGLSIYK